MEELIRLVDRYYEKEMEDSRMCKSIIYLLKTKYNYDYLKEKTKTE